MTPKQKKLYDFIASYIEQHGIAPSYGDMLQAMGAKSKCQIYNLLNLLNRDGHILIEAGKPRGIKLIHMQGKHKVTVKIDQRGQFLSADSTQDVEIEVKREAPGRTY